MEKQRSVIESMRPDATPSGCKKVIVIVMFLKYVMAVILSVYRTLAKPLNY